MTGQSLSQAANLFDFFHERVEDAVDKQHAPVSQDGVYYLSSLLVDQARAKPEDKGVTMVELHLEARSGDRVKAVQLYRKMGDRALYLSGFFRESLQNKVVSLDYYMNMGRAAYDQLSRMLRMPGAAGLNDVFAELAEGFPACAEVLAEVRSEVKERTDADILKLYEECMATGAPSAAERLRELGVIPMPGGGSSSEDSGVC